MTISKKHHIKDKETGYNYMYFDTVTSFNSFVDAQLLQLRPSNEKVWKGLLTDTQRMIDKQSDWYGHPIPKSVKQLDTHDHFLGMHLLEKVRSKIKKHLHRFMEQLDTSEMPTPKLAYNDRSLGMFSFDRAAMGMYRRNPVNLSTPLDKITSQLHIELGKKGLFTSVRKVYGYFKHKQTDYPSIRLYLMAGANAHIQGDQMLYVGLACAELVAFLELRGVAVEINVLIGTCFRNSVSIAVVRIKAFEESLNSNTLLLLSSDPRYFRFRGFKALIALADCFGLSIPKSLGRLQPDMGKQFVDLLGKDGFVFEGSYSLETAAKEVTRIIHTFSKKIKNEKVA